MCLHSKLMKIDERIEFDKKDFLDRTLLDSKTQLLVHSTCQTINYYRLLSINLRTSIFFKKKKVSLRISYLFHFNVRFWISVILYVFLARICYLHMRIALDNVQKREKKGKKKWMRMKISCDIEILSWSALHFSSKP